MTGKGKPLNADAGARELLEENRAMKEYLKQQKRMIYRGSDGRVSVGTWPD